MMIINAPSNGGWHVINRSNSAGMSVKYDGYVVTVKFYANDHVHRGYGHSVESALEDGYRGLMVCINDSESKPFRIH